MKEVHYTFINFPFKIKQFEQVFWIAVLAMSLGINLDLCIQIQIYKGFILCTS